MNDIKAQGGKVSESVKEYLKQPFLLNQKINDTIFEIERLRAQAESIGSVDLSKDKVQSGRVSDVVGDVVPLIVDISKTLWDRYDEYFTKKFEVESNIEKVSDDRLMNILLKRYVYFKSWEEIAVDLGYTYRHTTRLHGEALQAFESVYVNYVLECPI